MILVMLVKGKRGLSKQKQALNRFCKQVSGEDGHDVAHLSDLK